MEYGSRKFVVQKVTEFAPSWGHAIGVEYCAANGGIPAPDERVAISEFLSFLFGKQLLKVGETSYTFEAHLVESVASNPWGSSARRICRGDEHPPIRIDGLRIQSHPVETATRELLPRYLAKRDALKLSDTLWQYWCAKLTAVGLDMPGYYSALQGLAETWSNRTLPKTNLEPERFAPMLKALEAALDREASNVLDDIIDEKEREKVRKRLLQNLKNINRLSQNESFYSFFDRIDVPLGKTERAAFDARHRWSHGRGPSDQGYEEAVILGDAYWALLSRVLLRILEWGGEYLDVTQPSPVTRRLNEPMGSADWVKPN